MLSLFPAQQCDSIASAFVTCVFSLNARQEQLSLEMFFEDVTLCGLVGRYQHFAESCCLCLQGREYSSTLKMEAADFSDMLLPLCKTVQCHIPKDCNFYNIYCRRRSDV